MEFRLSAPTTSTREAQGVTVNEVKHQAKLAEWKEHILECRSQGIPVVEWCAQNGYHKTTYYKWEREIFGRITEADKERRSKHMKCLPSSQPAFAELPIASPETLTLPDTNQPMKFEPVAVIRVGKIELGLSNAVSGNLMRQLEGLMRFAE